jgi:ribonuclease Z
MKSVGASMQLTISGHSTALFSTWIFIEEWRLLFDAGDGVMSNLMHRSRKIRNVAISHADRDHIFGLLQLNHHNSGHNLESVLYPRQARSIERMRDFAWSFDRETAGKYEWQPVEPGQTYPLSNELGLRPIRNSHLARMGDDVRSLGYVVMRRYRRLKEEFEGLPQTELRRIGTEKGSHYLTEAREEPLLAYSGDTGLLPADTWMGAKTLIHEATFLREGEVEEGWPGHEHSTLDQVLPMAREASPDRLIIHHVSSRYRMGEVSAEVRRLSKELGISFPIWVFPPGETVEDLLSKPPIWE